MLLTVMLMPSSFDMTAGGIGGTGRYGTYSRPALTRRLDLGRADHLTPLLGFVGDELAEIGGRERKLSATFVGKPRLYFEIGESGVDFPVEPIDDLGGRVVGRAHAKPGARLIARHEVAHGRDVGQRLQARSGGYSQRPQLAGLDVLDNTNWRYEHELDLPGDQIGDRRRRAAIGHMDHVDA